MKREITPGLSLVYGPEEEEAAQLIAAAGEKSARLLGRRWGLSVPADCRVYVMTGWQPFLFGAAPWPWKILLALTYPLTARRAAAVWPQAGGWALSFGLRRVVGVKPPRLIESTERSLGQQLFRPDRSSEEVVQTVTCHELAHAFTMHLRLPPWLHEGIATLAMERYLSRPVVRSETLAYLSEPEMSRKSRLEHPEALLGLYARGYWRARWLDENHPALLKELLSERLPAGGPEQKIAAACGMDTARLWEELDPQIAAAYSAG